MNENLTKSSSVPGWITVFGAIMSGIVLLFFMALVVCEIMGFSIRLQTRPLVVFILAIGMAFAFATLGGSAVASGALPLPSGIDSPIKFALGGGIATFTVILILGHFLYVRYGPVDVKHELDETKNQIPNALAKKGAPSRDDIKQIEEINKAQNELSYGQVMFIPANAPLWLKIALQEKNKNVAESQGPDNNPRIIEYLRTIGLPEPISDKTPWCTAFVTWCIKQSGIKAPPNSGLARSWLNWGEALDKPRLGAIAVFSTFGLGGHVGFYVAENPTQVYVLGGDQVHMVNISAYSKDRLLGYRWPQYDE
jgi:uncharacterized protein (TIGR02594 family)